MGEESNGKDIEGRIERLESIVEALVQANDQNWSMFQALLGVKMIKNKETNQVGLMVVVPKKNEGKPGLLAELKIRMEKLWRQFGNTDVIIPDMGNPAP